MTEFDALLTTRDRNKVEFIVVGGAAAIAHGSARLTQDLDIVTGVPRRIWTAWSRR